MLTTALPNGLAASVSPGPVPFGPTWKVTESLYRADGQAFIHQQLDRVQTLYFCPQGIFALGFEHHKTAAADIEAGEDRLSKRKARGFKGQHLTQDDAWRRSTPQIEKHGTCEVVPTAGWSLTTATVERVGYEGLYRVTRAGPLRSLLDYSSLCSIVRDHHVGA